MPRPLRIIALFCLSLLLVACGFALRGSEPMTALPAASVYIRSPQENSPLVQSLQSALQAQQMQITSSAAQATYVLELGREDFNAQTATVNGRARAAQYAYQLSTQVSLQRNGEVLLAPERLQVENQLFFDSFNTAGSLQEEDLVRAEMRTQLVNQILSRLRAAAAQ